MTRLLLAALLWLAAAMAAHAHATLIAADPADGAVMARAPTTLRLTFDEPVSPLVLRLIGAGGHAAALTDFVLEGPSVVITPPLLGQGTHALSWRVVSADGHPVGGTVVFSIGAPTERPSLESIGDPQVRRALWAAKIIVYLGLFIGIGGAFFRAWLSRGAPAGERIVGVALAAGLIVTPLTVGLQGLDALELPLSRLAARAAWEAGLSTSYGSTAIMAAFALFAGLFSLAAQAIQTARGLALAALLGCGFALALSGHASAADPQWLMRPAVFVHAVGVAFWAGALVPLAFALRAGESQSLMRFSRAIPFVLVPMVAAGIALAVVQLGSVSALWTTAYGNLLLAKLAAVLALAALAGVNRFSLTQRASDEGARRRLARSILAELALVLIVFAPVAAWRFTPPPRALARASETPALVHIHTDKLMADIKFEPGHAGSIRATIVVLRGDFSAFEPKEVSLVLSNPAAGIEPIRRAATLQDEAWRIDALTIPAPGRWQIRVDVLVSDFERVSLEDSIEIRP